MLEKGYCNQQNSLKNTIYYFSVQIQIHQCKSFPNKWWVLQLIPVQQCRKRFKWYSVQMFNPLMHLFSRIMHLYHRKKFYCMISKIGMIKKLLHYYLEVKTLHLMRLGVTDGHNGSTGKETKAFPIIFPSYREKMHWDEKQVPFSDTNIT